MIRLENKIASVTGATSGIERGEAAMEETVAAGVPRENLSFHQADLTDVESCRSSVARIVIDAAGVSASFQTAMEMVRPLGQVVKVGWGAQPLGVSLDPIVQKAVRVQGSFSHNYPIWERVIQLLAGGQLDPRPLIGLQAPLEEWQAGFDGMHEGRIAKAVLIP